MILTAVICIVLGIGLILLCIFLPTENSEPDEPQSKDANVGDVIPDEPPSEPQIPVESGNSQNPEQGETPVTEEPEQPSVPVDPEPVEPEIPEVPETPSEPETPEVPETPSEPETPYVSSKNDPLLILANVDNPLPEDFEVGELETVQGNYKLDSRAASYAREMISDAKSEGITLQLCSSYRAISLQKTLFENKYNYYISNGWSAEDAYAKTATIIAIPGTSEHQTGLCMDVVTPSYQVLDAGYAETDAAKWLAENAYKYGFILRYPKDKQDITKIIFEPWHYRFVGIENAKLIKDSGLCLEEYLETLE